MSATAARKQPRKGIGALANDVLEYFNWPDDPEDAYWFSEAAQFETLERAIANRCEEPRYEQRSERIVEIQNQIQAAVSPELWQLMLELEGIESDAEAAKCEAAYLVGIAVARRMMRGA